MVRYAYLWRREAARRRDPSKDRPACIVAAIGRSAGGTDVVLLPITHTPPSHGEAAAELPVRVKRHLGLDASRSWVLLTECNIDSWPSPELTALPGQPGNFAYGFLPPRLFREIRDGFVAQARAGRMATTRRGS